MFIYTEGMFNSSVSAGDSEPWYVSTNFEFKLNKNNQRFEYFGMGPYENYIDMSHHVKQAWFESIASVRALLAPAASAIVFAKTEKLSLSRESNLSSCLRSNSIINSSVKYFLKGVAVFVYL